VIRFRYRFAANFVAELARGQALNYFPKFEDYKVLS